MSLIPRQTVDEILTKYELHPNLFDVYVEGNFDRDFIYEYLEATDRRVDVSVYAIDTIDIPSQVVLALGLGAGSNKARVLALAHFFGEKLAGQRGRIICIADADLDRLFGSLRDWDFMAHTDYTCMEVYALNERAMRKFLRFTCNLDDAAANEFMASASIILPVQFCMRAVIEALGLGIPAPAFATGLTVKRDLSSFSSDRYVQSCLRSHGLNSRKEEVETLFFDLLTRLDRDLRNKANGHDFVDLLFEFSWLRGGIKLHSKDSDVTKFGARVIASGLDFRELGAHPLFKKLGVSPTAHP